MRTEIAIVPSLAMLIVALSTGPVRGQTAPGFRRVHNTVHNLSVSGPGQLRATSETEVCVFCHTPHGAGESRFLWNRRSSGVVYQIYQSSSLKAVVGQPTGDSKLCLSCHDGTVAMGHVRNRGREIDMQGGGRVLPAGRSNLGTDLSDDHPISFAYSSSLAGGNLDLVPETAIPAPVRLDAKGEVQCTSCHFSHDNTNGNFLVTDDRFGTLCVSCHSHSEWTSSAHGTSSTLVTPGVAGELGIESVSVEESACGACHRSHGADSPFWLLRRENISAVCVACHDGRVAADVSRQTARFSTHGVVTSGPPDPTGRPYLEGGRLSCADCHDPHAAGSTAGLPAEVPASLAGVSGVDLGGVAVESIREVHELCFRCHGDTPAQVPPLVNRDIVQPNKRLQFQPSNPSFHPVGNQGASTDVPSLIPPLLTTSQITCGDCHDAEDSRRLGATGPAGPHGSIYRPLLAARYDTADFTTESPAAYALCYRCHQRNSVLGDESFPTHRKHVEDGSSPCSACHDPHGISSSQGTAMNHGHLINFDRSIVFPNSDGRLEFIDLGERRGECYLLCHGTNHNPLSY